MRKYQYYITNDDGDRDIYTGNWAGQTFTPTVDHMIASVKLKLFRVGNPGTITVSIKATSGGKPIGADLCSGTIEGNTITTDTNGDWYEIPLGNGFNLDIGAQYAIIVRAPDGDTDNKLSWRADIADATYSGGTYCSSSDSGTDWSTYSGVDCMFEEWGVGPASATTTTWGNLMKSQISSEKVEEAIARLIQDHDDDPNAHIEVGQSLYSHKASEIIDHVVNSIINDKIKDGIITNPKVNIYSRVYHAIVDTGGHGDYTDIQDAIDYVHGLGINGGKILIMPGLYQPTESITLYSNIDILGLDPLSTIIDFQQVVTRRFEAIGETSPYSTGTIATALDDATITGTGTSWLANATAGDYIQIGTAWFKIDSITDDTHLELTQPWRGKALSGESYIIATMLENISVRNLTIKGGGDTEGNATPGNLYFAYCIDTVIENNYLLDAPGSTSIITHSSRLTFRNNWPKAGVEAGAVFAWVTHSLIDNNKAGGSKEWDFSFAYCDNNTISNNYSPGCGRDGFTFNACKNNSIFGNISENNIRSGFQFVADTEFNNIFGNKANNNTESGMYFDGYSAKWPSYNTVNGNIAEDNGYYGIAIIGSDTTKIIITGNQLGTNGYGAIYDEGTGTVKANNIETS